MTEILIIYDYIKAVHYLNSRRSNTSQVKPNNVIGHSVLTEAF